MPPELHAAARRSFRTRGSPFISLTDRPLEDGPVPPVAFWLLSVILQLPSVRPPGLSVTLQPPGSVSRMMPKFFFVLLLSKTAVLCVEPQPSKRARRWGTPWPQPWGTVASGLAWALVGLGAPVAFVAFAGVYSCWLCQSQHRRQRECCGLV